MSVVVALNVLGVLLDLEIMNYTNIYFPQCDSQCTAPFFFLMHGFVLGYLLAILVMAGEVQRDCQKIGP
jgi:hypothetical protein